MLQFGSVIRPTDAKPGRILLRRDGDRTVLAITTEITAERSSARMMACVSVDDGHSGFILNEAITDHYWDVTDFVVVRPDLTSHLFPERINRTNGQLFIGSAGELIMVAIVRDGRSTHPLLVDIATGKQSTSFSSFGAVQIARWDLVVREANGELGATLFSWPAPATHSKQ